MRIVTLALLVALFLAAPLAAQTHVAKATAHPAQTKAEKPKAGAELARTDRGEKKHHDADLNAEVQQLKQMLAEQARELEAQRALLREQHEAMLALRRQMEQQAASADNSGAAAESALADVKLLEGQLEAVAGSQKELGDRVNKVTTDLADTRRTADGRFRQLGNFRFSGDLRVRMEPFIQDGALNRTRYRVRARFNVQGNLTDELFGGITLSTGTLDDPLSTNQTLTGFFNRKGIGFDRLFIQYKPKWLRNHVTVGAGKFAYPWVRTPMTFDNDVNPEGFYQQLAWDFKNSVFKNVTFVGFQLPLFERSGTISTSGATAGQVTVPGFDAWVFGSQIQTRWKLHDRVNLGLHIAAVNFINSDLIATALGGELRPSLPNTNTLRTSSGTTIGYASRFLYLDTIAELTIRTNSSKYPLQVLFNFVNNTRATNIQGSGASLTQTRNPERSGFWAELQVGRANEKKDVQFGYAFVRVEKDAVVGAFNESDLRSATNVRNHRLNFSYMALRNVQFNYAAWIGKLANAQDNTSLVAPERRLPGSPCATSPFTGCTDSFLKRMQMDLIYKF